MPAMAFGEECAPHLRQAISSYVAWETCYYHLFLAIHCIRGRDPIYRVRGVGLDNTLVTPQSPACPDMLTFFASGIIYRVRFSGTTHVQAPQILRRKTLNATPCQIASSPLALPCDTILVKEKIHTTD